MTFEYDIQKNSDLARNLKGRLMLVTGDIDDNVHPSNTYRLANALIKANKRFEFFLLPGLRHSFQPAQDYVFWLRADHETSLVGDLARAWAHDMAASAGLDPAAYARFAPVWAAQARALRYEAIFTSSICASPTPEAATSRRSSRSG